MSADKKLYKYILHIGYGKTGTTSLQNYLKINRSSLIEDGILYPDFKHFGTALNLTDHNVIGNALAGNKGWLNRSAEWYFSNIEKQVSNRSNINTVLLSGETFTGTPQPHLFNNTDEYWNIHEDKIKYLNSLLNGYKCKFIIYLQHQDDWVEASLNQAIKFYGLYNNPPDISIDGYIKSFAPRLDYYRQLKLWAKYFGKDSITVKIYSKDILVDNNIIDDFMNTINIPIKDSYKKLINTTRATNIRLCRDVLEVKRILNKIKYDKEYDRALAIILRDISKDITKNRKNKEEYYMLSYEDRKKIRRKYKESNDKLIIEFMPDDSDAIQYFNSEISLERLKYYPGLEVDNAIEIIYRLENEKLHILFLTKIFRIKRFLRKKIPSLHALFRMVQSILN